MALPFRLKDFPQWADNFTSEANASSPLRAPAAMKKNVFPLVVIALVVAVLSTGIFYGLIVSRMDGSAKSTPLRRPVAATSLEKGHVLKANDLRWAEAKNEAKNAEPGPMTLEDAEGRALLEKVDGGQVLTDKLLSPGSARSLASAIPDGQRAVTVHVSDSSSVLEILRAGDHIDVHSLSAKTRPRDGYSEADWEVRTILQNATVFQVGAPERGAGGRGVLTLLVAPEEAPRLSQSDAATRLRVVLRNRKDSSLLPVSPVNLSRSEIPPTPKAIVRSQFTPNPTPNALPSSPAKPLEPGIHFEIHLVEASPEELRQWSQSPSSIPAGTPAVWASSRLQTAQGGEVTWRGQDPAASLRVRLETRTAPDGGIEWRARTETSLGPGHDALRRSELPWNSGRQGSAIAGLLPASQAAAWREKFAPHRRLPDSTGSSELAVLISPAP